jgi:hypothetical protein
MIVFRIHQRLNPKKGSYGIDFDCGGVGEIKPTNALYQPSPITDLQMPWVMRDTRQDYYFGFESSKKLNEWYFYEEWLFRLKQNDMVICTYDIDEIHFIIGEKQLAFKLDLATKINQFEM